MISPIEGTVADINEAVLNDPDLARKDPYGEGWLVSVQAPDSKINLKNVVESGDWVFVEGEYNGTNTGPLASPQGTIPATGKRFVLPYVDVFEVRNGKIAKHRTYFDQMSFLGQLGLIPAPATA